MNDHPNLLPEDRPAYERCVDQGIRTLRASPSPPDPRLSEVLRTMALNATFQVNESAAPEYEEYVRRRAAARASPGWASGAGDAFAGAAPTTAPARKPFPRGRVALVVLGLLLGGSALAVLLLGEPGTAAVVLGAVAALTVLGAVPLRGLGAVRLPKPLRRRRPAPEPVAQAGRADGPTRGHDLRTARREWEAALLYRGVLPFLRTALESSAEVRLDARLADVRSTRTIRLRPTARRRVSERGPGYGPPPAADSGTTTDTLDRPWPGGSEGSEPDRPWPGGSEPDRPWPGGSEPDFSSPDYGAWDAADEPDEDEPPYDDPEREHGSTEPGAGWGPSKTPGRDPGEDSGPPDPEPPVRADPPHPHGGYGQAQPPAHAYPQPQYPYPGGRPHPGTGGRPHPGLPSRRVRPHPEYQSARPHPEYQSARPHPDTTGRPDRDTPPPPDPRRMVVELVEQAPPGTEVPLQVQIVQDRSADDRAEPGIALRAFAVPADGARLLITVHAPGLIALGDLQQEVTVRPGTDSDVLTFGLRTAAEGLRAVTVRAFHAGTFLGELRVQLSVRHGTPARSGPPRVAPLASVAFDPGEVTLQVLRGEDGSYSFQLISETCYAPESFRLLGGDPRWIADRVYRELRQAAAESGPGSDGVAGARRLRNLGVEMWASAVPEPVRRQFWAEADRISSVTVLGAHDLVPWELLYPLDGDCEGEGFLSEWLPVIRRTFGQQRVRELDLSRAAFVVPPDSPEGAAEEIASLRRLFGAGVTDLGVFTERSAVSGLVEGGFGGLLHFACHNTFSDEGSQVAMADGPFDPIDLAYATHSRSLRDSRPLVFFNACRSAGEIGWYAASLGWGTQFLRSGAGAFVGTLWPVRSDAAHDFARAFYTELLTRDRTLGQASLHARRAVRRGDGDPTGLAYAVYGSPAARAGRLR
ncbi:CHAT domain-containing protein [Streptomyces uncialis]|uniref:CHAT domain-containing protein n=1 Tax=Streptomyces uncialis TaxID=1048205 RepID=UPI0037A079A9